MQTYISLSRVMVTDRLCCRPIVVTLACMKGWDGDGKEGGTHNCRCWLVMQGAFPAKDPLVLGSGVEWHRTLWTRLVVMVVMYLVQLAVV